MGGSNWERDGVGGGLGLLLTGRVQEPPQADNASGASLSLGPPSRRAWGQCCLSLPVHTRLPLPAAGACSK